MAEQGVGRCPECTKCNTITPGTIQLLVLPTWHVCYLSGVSDFMYFYDCILVSGSEEVAQRDAIWQATVGCYLSQEGLLHQ